MELLLQEGSVDLNVFDFSDKYTLLTYCYVNKKHKAFNMMIGYVNRLDPNIKNSDGTTLFGQLFY